MRKDPGMKPGVDPDLETGRLLPLRFPAPRAAEVLTLRRMLPAGRRHTCRLSSVLTHLNRPEQPSHRRGNGPDERKTAPTGSPGTRGSCKGSNRKRSAGRHGDLVIFDKVAFLFLVFPHEKTSLYTFNVLTIPHPTWPRGSAQELSAQS